MDYYNDIFRCRFCGAKVVQSGRKEGQQWFYCTNENCRAVVTFSLPDEATERQYRNRYMTHRKYFRAESLDKSVRREGKFTDGSSDQGRG